MATIHDGPCCVCGTKTTQRCPVCAKSGTQIWFCSREHQKLVWFAHKRVCGAKSNPFRLPLFTPGEAEDLKANLREPAVPSGGQGSLEERLTAYLKGAVKDWPTTIDTLTEGAAVETPQSRWEHVLLLALRTHRAEQQVDSTTTTGWTQSTFANKAAHASLFRQSEPVVIVTRFIMDLYSAMESINIRPSSFEQKEWYRDLLHHTLIGATHEYLRIKALIAFFAHGAAVERTWVEPPAVVALRRLQEGTRKIYPQILERIQVDDPAVAEEMAQQFAVMPLFRQDRISIGGWVSTDGGIELRRV